MNELRIKLVTLPAALFQKIKDAPTIPLLVGVCILAAIGFCLGDGYYNGKWEGMSAAFIILLGYEIYKRFGLACALMISYVFASGIWVLDYTNRYSTVQPYDLLGLKFFTAQSMYKLILMITPFLLLPIDRSALRNLGRYMCLAFVGISLFQVYEEWAWSGCSTVNACGGALKNPSLNASMLVVALPLAACLIPYGKLLILPILGAAMLGKSSIGIGMCSLYLLVMAIAGARKNLGWSTLTIFGVIPAIFAVARITHGYKQVFDSSGRFQMWKFFIGLWAKNPKNWVFGTGFGTFGVFSTNLQQAFQVNATDWWIWMHNDYLQMLFECGIVGLALMVWMYITCAWKLRASAPELHSFLMFGVVLGCEYSLHVAPCCLYAAWIAAYALIQPERPAPIFSDEECIDDPVMRYALCSKMWP